MRMDTTLSSSPASFKSLIKGFMLSYGNLKPVFFFDLVDHRQIIADACRLLRHSLFKNSSLFLSENPGSAKK